MMINHSSCHICVLCADLKVEPETLLKVVLNTLTLKVKPETLLKVVLNTLTLTLKVKPRLAIYVPLCKLHKFVDTCKHIGLNGR